MGVVWRGGGPGGLVEGTGPALLAWPTGGPRPRHRRHGRRRALGERPVRADDVLSHDAFVTRSMPLPPIILGEPLGKRVVEGLGALAQPCAASAATMSAHAMVSLGPFSAFTFPLSLAPPARARDDKGRNELAPVLPCLGGSLRIHSTGAQWGAPRRW